MAIEYLPLPSVVSFIQIITTAVAVLAIKLCEVKVDALEWDKMKAFSMYLVAFVAIFLCNLCQYASSLTFQRWDSHSISGMLSNCRLHSRISLYGPFNAIRTFIDIIGSCSSWSFVVLFKRFTVRFECYLGASESLSETAHLADLPLLQLMCAAEYLTIWKIPLLVKTRLNIHALSK